MRIVNASGNDLAGIPTEGRITSDIRTPHLITSVDFENANSAFGTGLCILFNRLCRFEEIGLTYMGSIRLFDFQTLGAGGFITCPALVCCR